MTLEEFTGRSSSQQAPKTAREVEVYIERILQSNPNITVVDFLDRVSVVLAQIGDENLDSTKPTGSSVSYKGSPWLPEWSEKNNQTPFYINDHLTGKSVPDPRVIAIGKLIYKLGQANGRQGHEFMYELYVRTAQKIHCFVSPLNDAWTGIGTWNEGW